MADQVLVLSAFEQNRDSGAQGATEEKDFHGPDVEGIGSDVDLSGKLIGCSAEGAQNENL